MASYLCNLLITIAVLTKFAQSANILFFAGIPSPSHHIYNRVLAFGLAEKGHNVTMVASDVEKRTHKNFHFILTEGVYEDIHDSFDINSVIGSKGFLALTEMYAWGNQICHSYFKSKGLKQLMDYPKDFKFDLVVYDITLGQCLYPIIDRFNKPPVVGITAFLLPHYLSIAMGNHVYPSYYPHYSLEATNEMSFFERLDSFLLTYGETFYRNYIFANKQNELMKSYYGDNVRGVLEVERSIALLLSNTDPILDYPIALPPNIIPIGGLHIQPPKPLPEDLKQVMDNAKNGVVLFSLGSNIQSSELGTKIRDELLAAFKNLKQTVIWKYEKDIENLPSNVVIRKWLPQSDMLAHPNCKLFIGHGGALSTQEAIYYGVPIVGLPGFADQTKNVHKIVSKGFGGRLDFSNLERGVIYDVLKEVLDNPEYSRKIKAASRKYRDQPQTPLERALFWTEYVLRHQGAEDLALPARDMYFFQTSNLDIVLFLLSSLLTIIYVICTCLRKICGSSKKPKQKTN